MAHVKTLQEVIGNRLAMDDHLCARAAREYDAMTSDQQRAAYIHQTRILHEITLALQNMRDGESTAGNLLDHIQALAWSEDGAPVVTQAVSYPPQHQPEYYRAVNEWLVERGYEAESAEHIDTIELPPDVQQAADQAGITPSD